ncbi:50S ribosomal protein L1 [bacterium]|nr:50S ribosomal protein L1 [candidate division CSSED10-310 bacterium]
MARHGKKYRAVKEEAKQKELYELEEAIAFLKDKTHTKFDESLEVAVRLGVNPRHADQIVRGTVSLPFGTGKTKRVIVFAQGEKISEAREAGAEEVGGDDLIEKVQGGWMEFDAAISTPDLMGKVGRLGRVLGPRGLMPNPKTGTVTFDVGKAVKEIKGGKIAFRVDKAGILHAPLGKLSFEREKLLENAKTFINMVIKLKPPTAKGTYIKSITLTSTMNVGLKLDVAQVVGLFR